MRDLEETNLLVTQTGIELIKKWEGFRSKPYQDPRGIWTIGWGHTRGVTESSKEISLEEGEKLLLEDIEGVEMDLERVFDSLDLEDNQWDALVSLGFNLRGGPLALRRVAPKLTLAVLQRRWEDAAKEFLDIVLSGGIPLEGLRSRRKEEAELFLKGADESV